MKTKYFILSIMIWASSSCSDFLDVPPTDFLSPTNYYQTEEQLEFARASVYDILGAGGLYQAYALYLLAWDGDAAYMNRATLTTGPWNYFYSTADPYNAGLWSALWQGVNRANVVLANVDRNADLDIRLRDTIRGEVLFLRGYYYYLLVQYYGGVPLKIEPTASVNDTDHARSSVKEVYDQIVSDMEAAEALVPGITEVGYSGAVSKSAVRGVLARVNLTMAGHPLRDQSRFAEAKKWAKMVMDDPEANHSLNPDYSNIFINMAADVYDIKESIFEVEFFGNGLDQYSEVGYNGWINGPVVAAGAATGRSDSYMSITAKLYNVYEPGDSRKFWNIAHFAYVNSQVNGEKSFTAATAAPATELAKYGFRPAKFRREYERVLPKSINRTPINFPILRYTDVLLMYAEAENALNGPTAEVVDILNSVRWRGWAKGVKTITVTNGGSGYTEAPEVIISGGIGGKNAEATAQIDASGTVVSITLNRDPAGIEFYQHGHYTSEPSITIQGGGGSGASAEATIYTQEDAALSSAATGSKESLHAVIIDERMREFNGEGLRKSDLLRWGIFLQVHRDMGNTIEQDSPGAFYARYYSNVTERDLLMPIPAAEMAVNLAMEQNPGW